MKTWNKTISLLRNDEQKIVANGYPDLRIDRILDGSVEGLDVHELLEPRTIEVSAEVKCSLNISQTSPICGLSKAHHHELVTAIELDDVPVTFVAVDTLLELVFVKERHDLSEDCFSFVHGLRMAS